MTEVMVGMSSEVLTVASKGLLGDNEEEDDDDDDDDDDDHLDKAQDPQASTSTLLDILPKW